MSAGSLPLGVMTIMLSTCLFAQEEALIASNHQSEADRSFMSAERGHEDADAPGSPAPPNSAAEDRRKNPSAWQISIYPVFAWAPIFGISTQELPSSPGGGGGSGNLLPPSNTSSSFNGAAFAGFRVEKSKWSTDGTVLWAGLSSERNNPFARISVDAIFGQLMAGREIVPDLFLEGGFRRIALNLSLRLGISQRLVESLGSGTLLWGSRIAVNSARNGRFWGTSMVVASASAQMWISPLRPAPSGSSRGTSA